MRNRVLLVLMEQLIMILVFSVACAICLNAFVFSWKTSKASEVKYEAAFIAQNVAEEIKATDGNILNDWDNKNGIFYKEYIENNRQYMVEVEFDEAFYSFNKTELKVFLKEEEIFAISVAWQEAAKNE